LAKQTETSCRLRLYVGVGQKDPRGERTRTSRAAGSSARDDAKRTRGLYTRMHASYLSIRLADAVRVGLGSPSRQFRQFARGRAASVASVRSHYRYTTLQVRSVCVCAVGSPKLTPFQNAALLLPGTTVLPARNLFHIERCVCCTCGVYAA